MSDNTQRLIERLRSITPLDDPDVGDEAADALEAMHRENEKLADIIETHIGGIEVLQARVTELEAMQKEIERLKGENGGAAWILEWMLADKYRKPDVPAVIRQAQKHYQTTLADNERLQSRVAELESALREGLEVADDLIEKTDIYLGINDAYDRHDAWEKQAKQALKRNNDELL